jgi:signal peptide peptidase SppA
MKSNLTRVLRALYCEPWLIRPEMHQRLCEIARAHANGEAHEDGGIVASFTDDMKKQGQDVRIVDGVAVVNVGGVIGRRFSSFLNSSGVTSIDVLGGVIRNAVDDVMVDAIVLDVDSPGGTVTGVPEAAEIVERAATEKPVIAYASGMMASAAYWISAGADAIFASPSADVGSIGVYTVYTDVSRMYEDAGIDVELFKQGKFKAAGVPGIPLTDEQKELIQDGVNNIAEWFKGYVAESRPGVALEAMEGQTYLGKDALEVGLIDGTSTLDEAIEYARNEAESRR